jgi:2-amino-4-hydroxy-6-hydroxymethyldihydropteridine diphosphokinase
MEQATHLYAVAVGSNRRHVRHGVPSGVVAAAIAELDAGFGLFAASPIVLNPAIGGAGREFANAVALVESALDPSAMLNAVKAIERAFGRRPGRRWASRVLDLDLVAWSGGRFASRRLTIPHPRLAERDFVAGPLAAIAPHWPIVGALTPQHLAARLGKRRARG